jgi:hypothetical protein
MRFQQLTSGDEDDLAGKIRHVRFRVKLRHLGSNNIYLFSISMAGGEVCV